MVKKSLEIALNEAWSESVQKPGVDIYVMDKRREQAVICMDEWVREQRVLDGWSTVAIFRSGEQIMSEKKPEKRSVTAARKEAKTYSEEHPNYYVRVMDKRTNRAVCCTSEKSYMRLSNAGWKVVAIYYGGKEV